MNIEEYRNYCLKKPGSTEAFPFDKRTLVFKVGGKMFALCDVDEFQQVNLKCDPELASRLREKYDSVRPGYHMNKKHWNTVILDGTMGDRMIYEMTDHSYQLVFDGLPAKIKNNL